MDEDLAKGLQPVLHFLSLRPTTRRYVGLLSFLFPPSSHKGLMYLYNSILLIQFNLVASCHVLYLSDVVI